MINNMISMADEINNGRSPAAKNVNDGSFGLSPGAKSTKDITLGLSPSTKTAKISVAELMDKTMKCGSMPNVGGALSSSLLKRDLHQADSLATEARLRSAGRERKPEVPQDSRQESTKLPPALATYEPVPLSSSRRTNHLGNQSEAATKTRRISSAPGRREQLALPGYQGGYISGLTGCGKIHLDFLPTAVPPKPSPFPSLPPSDDVNMSFNSAVQPHTSAPTTARPKSAPACDGRKRKVQRAGKDTPDCLEVEESQELKDLDALGSSTDDVTNIMTHDSYDTHISALFSTKGSMSLIIDVDSDAEPSIPVTGHYDDVDCISQKIDQLILEAAQKVKSPRGITIDVRPTPSTKGRAATATGGRRTVKLLDKPLSRRSESNKSNKFSDMDGKYGKNANASLNGADTSSSVTSRLNSTTGGKRGSASSDVRRRISFCAEFVGKPKLCVQTKEDIEARAYETLMQRILQNREVEEGSSKQLKGLGNFQAQLNRGRSGVKSMRKKLVEEIELQRVLQEDLAPKKAASRAGSAVGSQRPKPVKSPRRHSAGNTIAISALEAASPAPTTDEDEGFIGDSIQHAVDAAAAAFGINATQSTSSAESHSNPDGIADRYTVMTPIDTGRKLSGPTLLPSMHSPQQPKERLSVRTTSVTALSFSSLPMPSPASLKKKTSRNVTPLATPVAARSTNSSRPGSSKFKLIRELADLSRKNAHSGLELTIGQASTGGFGRLTSSKPGSPLRSPTYRSPTRSSSRTHSMSLSLQDRDAGIYTEEVVDEAMQAKIRTVLSMEIKKKYQFWSKIVQIVSMRTLMCHRVQEQLQEARDEVERHRAAAATCIKRSYRRYFCRRLNRLLATMRRDHANARRPIRLMIRNWRRRQAVIPIKSFIYACAKCTNQGVLAFYIIRYMRACKKIQRNVRSFLQCKRARVLCVLRIWEDMELHFIKRMLRKVAKEKVNRKSLDGSITQSMMAWQQRRSVQDNSDAMKAFNRSKGRHRSAGGLSAQSAAGQVRALTRLAKIDSDRIEKWSKLENKVENFLDRSDGRLTEVDLIKKYLLPNTVRIPLIKKIIENARKECIRNQAEVAWQLTKNEKKYTEFSEADVSLFLKSDEQTMLRTLQTKLKVPKKTSISYNFVSSKFRKKVPFIFYKHLKYDHILGTIKNAHELRHTFDVAVKSRKHTAKHTAYPR